MTDKPQNGDDATSDVTEAPPLPDARISLGDPAGATARIEVTGLDGQPVGSLALTINWNPPAAAGLKEEGRGDDAPPHTEPTGEETTVDPSIDIADRIRRGVSRAGLSPTEVEELHQRHNGDETAVLRELVDVVNRLEAEAGEGAGEPTSDPAESGGKTPAALQILKRDERQTVIDTLRRAGIPDTDVKAVIQKRLKAEALASLELGQLSAAARKIGFKPSATLSRAGWAAAILEKLVADEKTAAGAPPDDDGKAAEEANASYARSIPRQLAKLKTLDPEAAKGTDWKAEAAKNPRATLAALGKAIKLAESRKREGNGNPKPQPRQQRKDS